MLARLLLYLAFTALLGGCGGAPADTSADSGTVDRSDPTSTSDQADRPPGYNPNRRVQLYELPKDKVRIGDKTLHVWLATNSISREEGMMHLLEKDVPDDHGMLFAFLEEMPLSFWMKNTKLPLDIAFLDSKGKVLNVERMKPDELQPVLSRRPAKYALEAKAGTFRKYGLRPGMTLGVPPAAVATD